MSRRVKRSQSRPPALSTTELVGSVEVVDAPRGRERQSRDLVGVAANFMGVLVIAAMAVVAQSTVGGVTKDVQAITSGVAVLLRATISLLMNLATLLAPAAVLVSLLIRRQLALAVQGLIAGLTGTGLAVGVAWLIRLTDYEPLIHGMSVGSSDQRQVAIAPLAAAMAGILTAAGPRARRAIYRVSWNLLWVALATLVLTGGSTLPAAVITVLLGRVAGEAVRFLGGVSADRASGRDLIEGIRRAGLDPVRVVRVRDISAPESPTVRLNVSSIRDGSYAPGGSEPPEVAQAAASDSTALALRRQMGNRVYAVFDKQGDRWDAIVLDGDRQIVGWLNRTWRTLRLKGMDSRPMVSLRQAAERVALLDYAAQAAGVRTPALVGMGEAAESMLLVQTHPDGLRSAADMRPAEITDAALVDAWRQLNAAHEAGLAHRAITWDTVLFDGVGEAQHVWLTGWDNGDVASSDLARALDLAQMAAVLALRVGAKRTVAAACQVLPDLTLAQVGPLIQPVALPSQVRDAAHGDKAALEELRAALVDLNPSQDPVQPPSLVRLGWGKMVVLTLGLVAAWVVLTTVNFDSMVSAVRSANVWWMAGSFGLSMATYLGAAMTLVGFYPGKLSLWRAVLAQAASSFWALAAPGGVGPAAISLRLLYKRGANNAIGVATVALTQVALFFTTMVVILGAALASGDSGVLSNLPSTAIVLVILGLAALASLLLIPRLRAWVWLRIGPTFAQVWPRLSWVMSRPKRLVFALVGTVVQTGGYIAAFWAALQAFGLDQVSTINLTLVFLLGNSAGSAVPTPGGLGGVEFALTAGLTTAGVATAMAASAAVLFRVITYWARVPLGWVAYRYLQRHGDL